MVAWQRDTRNLEQVNWQGYETQTLWCNRACHPKRRDRNKRFSITVRRRWFGYRPNKRNTRKPTILTCKAQRVRSGASQKAGTSSLRVQGLDTPYQAIQGEPSN